ncbi:MAG: hypothetical protein ABR569_00760, partial [Gaiellaceae bacterium]
MSDRDGPLGQPDPADEREPAPGPEQPVQPTGGDYAPSVAEQLALYQRAGGVVTPILTAAIAFLIGGLVVLASGSNPFSTYRAIFDGTGLNWLFPWVSGAARTGAALNLQQTLILTTPLILCGLAVAFAFRCGMFNIGGQGQYTAGSIMAVWIGSSFLHMNGVARNYFLAMAISGMFAGLAGAIDILGWQFRLNVNDIQASQIG